MTPRSSRARSPGRSCAQALTDSWAAVAAVAAFGGNVAAAAAVVAVVVAVTSAARGDSEPG